MLKCPKCGARVKGPDLLTGICSVCQARLSQSIEILPEESNERTVQSDVFDLNPQGSSIVQSDDNRSDSSISGVRGLGTFDHSFDLGLTPAAAADGLKDHDTHTDSAGGSGSGDSGEQRADQTFISDEWSDGGSGASSGSGTLPPDQVPNQDVARTYQSDLDEPDDEQNLKTFVSDEFQPVDVEASQRTYTDDNIPADDADDNNRTYVAPDLSEQSPDRTFVSDSASDDSTSSDKTFVSDDVPEAIVRTVQSNFGVEEAEERPNRTIKGKEQERLKSPKSTLVIKTKLLRDVKVQPKTAKGQQDPEYELVKVLGEGGMGVVYSARQTSIDRDVALKMIKGPAATNEKQKAKFLAEAVVTGDLDHPNIVPIYDVGRNEEGALFYSMKKVQGTPWDKIIEEKSQSENIDILMRVADAIAFAHARGVVHRDLKPENTMLGEFGEVLVMDWGLAQPGKGFRKSASITDSATMGGTPAYMAPEMATGPIEKISPLSDVYLLGAILYEILTGKPPHQGKNAMKCLMAAARNEIVPATKTGELIDIALKAMRTDPAERYQDVRAFQHAIREYQSHSESILLSTNAEDDLVHARSTDSYQEYAKALFGFQEAAELWSGNKRAIAGTIEAKLAYAESARRKGDYDLGLSLLDPAEPDHAKLAAEIQSDKREREARQHRLKTLRKLAILLVGAVFLVVTVAAVWISYEADRARKAERTANTEKAAAVLARNEESKARKDADHARDLAETKRVEAEEARKQEVVAKQQAVAARDLAETKRIEAEEARKQEEIAKRKEEYEAYIARIGLASAKIDENAFDTARELLEGCKPELRNWEWGRLMHLCSQSVRTIDGKAPLDALALSPDGKLIATGGWDGTARVWSRDSGEMVAEFKHGGLYVHSVAFSPDGSWLATGSDDPAGFVQLWDLASKKVVKTFQGHDDAVLSVVFSRDGKRLLTSSYDKTARLWNVSDGTLVRKLAGHTWWVWQAVFSSDEQRIATASQDGTVLVWNLGEDKPKPPFTGHHGPVYCVAFSPDDKTIVSGGYDRRILAWQPDEILKYEFKNLERGKPVVPVAHFREIGTHATSVHSINFSKDGDQLLSGGADNTVRLWDFSTGLPLKTFRGHDSSVHRCVFTADGRALYSVSHDGSIREWSIADYAELRAVQGRTLEGHSDAVLAAAFSRDQRTIVTASRDRTARTWDAVTGAEQHTFVEGHSFLASRAIFFDHGRRLLTAAVDNTLRVWDVATGSELRRIDRTGRAAAAAISHDERLILTGGNHHEVQMWDARSGERVRVLEGHQSEVTAVAFSSDDRWIASGDSKGHTILWNRETGEIRARLEGHTRRISAVLFLPDGSRLLTASGDKTVAQWDLASGKELKDAVLKHADSILTAELTPDGKQLVTSDADRTIRVWDLATNQVINTMGPFPENVNSLSISHDGTRLLTAQSEARTVRLWNLETGSELQIPDANGKLGPVADLKKMGGLLWGAVFAPGDDILTIGGSEARLWDLKRNSERMSFSPHGAVASASFSPNGKWLVTGSWDNSAKIWNAETGKTVVKLDGAHSGFVNTAAFSPDGQHVLTASDDGTARLWKVTLEDPAGSTPTAEVIRTFEGHRDRVRFAAFSTDGKQIVTASSDKTAKLWDVATGEVLRTFEGHQWAVLSVAFSTEGTHLITGSEDNTAKIWNVATGECERTLAGHTAPVASVAFAPDGKRVLTGSRDQAAKLWDATTGKEILTLNHHTEDVTSVCFSPDGRQVLTGSRDGTAVIWLAVDWNPMAMAAEKAGTSR